jgi:hypothetical protein
MRCTIFASHLKVRWSPVEYMYIERERSHQYFKLSESFLKQVMCVVFCYWNGKQTRCFFFQWLIPKSLQTQICIDHKYGNKISIPALITKTKSFEQNSHRVIPYFPAF